MDNTNRQQNNNKLVSAKLTQYRSPLRIFGCPGGTLGRSLLKCETHCSWQTSVPVQNFSEIRSAVLQKMRTKQTDRQTKNKLNISPISMTETKTGKKCDWRLQRGTVKSSVLSVNNEDQQFGTVFDNRHHRRTVMMVVVIETRDTSTRLERRGWSVELPCQRRWQRRSGTLRRPTAQPATVPAVYQTSSPSVFCQPRSRYSQPRFHSAPARSSATWCSETEFLVRDNEGWSTCRGWPWDLGQGQSCRFAEVLQHTNVTDSLHRLFSVIHNYSLCVRVCVPYR